MPSSNVDIAIIGGGMAGLAMAAALADSGLTVGLIDKTPLKAQQLPSFDGRVSAVALGSKRMLTRLGAWDAMAAYAEPILDIRVSDGDSPFALNYNYREAGIEAGGEPFGWIIENRYIRQALADVVTALPNVTLTQGALSSLDGNVLSIEPTAGDAPITLNANLVIGADSKFSKLRELAGIAQHVKHYGQTGIVCTIAHQQPHRGLAHERFLPRGPFAILPMRSDSPLELASGSTNYQHFSSLVWVEPSDLAPDYAALPADEINTEIQQRIGDYLGKVAVVGDVFTYPLMLSLSEAFTAPHVALIGDAAHGIHPIAGQGINLGFRDVAALEQLLRQQWEQGADIADAAMLAAYAAARRLDTLAMAGATDTLNGLFSNNLPPVKLGRGLGLWAVGKMPGVKKRFMQHAMGISGKLPDLMCA